jgi:hypothetical protein
MAKAAVIAANDANVPGCTHAGSASGTAGSGQDRDRMALVRRIADALRERLGAERYAVWFGDAVGIEVEFAGAEVGASADGGCVVGPMSRPSCGRSVAVHGRSSGGLPL